MNDATNALGALSLEDLEQVAGGGRIGRKIRKAFKKAAQALGEEIVDWFNEPHTTDQPPPGGV